MATWEEYYPMHKLEKIVHRLRMLISQDEHPPVIILFEEGIIHNLSECLTSHFDPFPSLENEALWIFINIFANCSRSMVDIVGDAKLHEKIMRLLRREGILPIADNV